MSRRAVVGGLHYKHTLQVPVDDELNVNVHRIAARDHSRVSATCRRLLAVAVAKELSDEQRGGQLGPGR